MTASDRNHRPGTAATALLQLQVPFEGDVAKAQAAIASVLTAHGFRIARHTPYDIEFAGAQGVGHDMRYSAFVGPRSVKVTHRGGALHLEADLAQADRLRTVSLWILPTIFVPIALVAAILAWKDAKVADWIGSGAMLLYLPTRHMDLAIFVSGPRRWHA